MEESDTDGVECSWKVVSARREAAWHDTLLLPVLTYGSDIIMEGEGDLDVQMDNLGGLLGIRRIDKVQTVKIRRLCRVKKGVGERNDEGVHRWFGHVEDGEQDC